MSGHYADETAPDDTEELLEIADALSLASSVADKVGIGNGDTTVFARKTIREARDKARALIAARQEIEEISS